MFLLYNKVKEKNSFFFLHALHLWPLKFIFSSVAYSHKSTVGYFKMTLALCTCSLVRPAAPVLDVFLGSQFFDFSFLVWYLSPSCGVDHFHGGNLPLQLNVFGSLKRYTLMQVSLVLGR